MAGIEEESRLDGSSGLSRRQAIVGSVGAVAGLGVLGAIGFELVENGLVPGKYRLDALLGACNIPVPAMKFSGQAHWESGSFYSKARGRTVGYTLAYPPGHESGSNTPLIIVLHGRGGDHTNAMPGVPIQRAPAQVVAGHRLPPTAFVSVDGGNGYWSYHPTDDPMKMLITELIPFCQRRGFGLGTKQIGVLGVSMGGYGALLLAEKRPDLIAAAAVLSPAIWRTWTEANQADPGGFYSQTTWKANDVTANARRLKGVAVRVASSFDDPFFPDIQTFVKSLPKGAVIDFSRGCHAGRFADAQEPASVSFVCRHLAASA